MNKTSGELSRRRLLKWTGTTTAMAMTTAIAAACVPEPGFTGVDQFGVRTLPGFTTRIIAESGKSVPGTNFYYRAFPDGAATFVDPERPGGWYLASNHEIPAVGGVSSIRFNASGDVVDAFSICDNTSLNCAGGATPWGTWLTCEEYDWGHVWECDPTGKSPAQQRPQMGAFKHEAAVVGPDHNVYMTEDVRDGALYRFVPNTPGDLRRGVLEVATGDAAVGTVVWKRVPNPIPGFLDTPCRKQVPDTIAFNGGEGMAILGTKVLFATKGDDRIWEYDIATAMNRIRFQAGQSASLSGVDNLWIDEQSGAVFVAEDGGDMQVVILRNDNTLFMVAQIPGQQWSEITGPCMSPDRKHLYFSSQRGVLGTTSEPAGLPVGITYAISGPWDSVM